ncbi:TonB-dependent receptor domain-containing protein [Jeongeupia naejangsanensis]|uniref:TonB-dependent receptor n=1 Tax=Jeongeupia naejangsanensis TaxID=613195 RepID=A0ABS2BPN6_9NEIS|nr:TonB-dependent receptor [Jeongeupia naejangsanensis]MBM3117523.1 TonB-dependent receptor [Jeongeupia naejangsanensis]
MLQARFTLRCLPLFLSAGFACAADVPSFDADPVIVTATRVASPRSSLSSDTTVISAKELQQAGSQSLGQVLSRVPGVEFARTGGLGQPASLYLRGANGNQTLVLLDGQRLAPGADGSSAFDTIPVSMIDRIEIVRGSASGLYGADAVGGVVQIFTKSGKGAPSGSVTVDAGSDRTFGGSANVGGTVGDTRFSVSVDAHNSDGFNLTKPTSMYYEADRDGWQQRSSSASLSHFFGDNVEVGVRGSYVDTKADYDGGAYDQDPLSHRTQSTGAAFANVKVNDWWQSNFLAGIGRDRYVTESSYPSNTATTQQQFQWTNILQSGIGQWLVGAEYLRESLDSSTDYDQTTRYNSSVQAGWQNDFGPHHLQANVRYDDNSQFGGKTTGGVGYAWRFVEGWQLFANAGTSFHVPSFVDLYYPSWPGFAPASNPNLQPEEGKSVDGGVRWQSGVWKMDATAFYNRIDNLITLDANYTPQNVNAARIRGLTLNGNGALGAFELGANVTWQDPENEDTDKQLARRAKVYGGMTLAQTIGDWRWNANWQAAGRRYDDQANTKPLAGYGKLDLGLDYQIAKQWSAGAQLLNAFDRDYELARGYNNGGRMWFLNLRYSGA